MMSVGSTEEELNRYIPGTGQPDKSWVFDHVASSATGVSSWMSRSKKRPTSPDEAAVAAMQKSALL